MAANHGLSPLGTLNDIKNSVMKHISEGAYTQFEVVCGK
jgi:hypothetical protein